jgi:hypothetical protein
LIFDSALQVGLRSALSKEKPSPNGRRYFRGGREQLTRPDIARKDSVS